MSLQQFDVRSIDVNSAQFQAVLDAWPDDSGLSPEQVAWKLRRSPNGPAWVLAAMSGNAVAALLVIGRTKSVVGGQVLSSGLIYQTVTVPEWRRKGLMSSLLSVARAEGMSQGFSLIVALPNPNSVGVYTKHGFSRESFMRGWVAPRPRDSFSVLKAFRSGTTFISTPKGPASDNFHLPEQEVPPAVGCARSFRTAELLEWRLGGYPQSEYRVVTSGGLTVICRDGFRGKIPERQVLSTIPLDPRLSVRALRGVRRDFPGLVSFAVNDGPWARLLLASGFLPTPKGSPVHVLRLGGTPPNTPGQAIFFDGLDVHTW